MRCRACTKRRVSLLPVDDYVLTAPATKIDCATPACTDDDIHPDVQATYAEIDGSPLIVFRGKCRHPISRSVMAVLGIVK